MRKLSLGLQELAVKSQALYCSRFSPIDDRMLTSLAAPA